MGRNFLPLLGGIMSELSNIKDNVYKEQGLKEITIKNNTYTIQLLPAYEGFAIGMEIIKTLLPAFGAFLDNEQKGEFILPEENSLFSEVALLLVSQIDKLNITDIVSRLLRSAKCDGEDFSVDEKFRGRYSALLSLVEFSLKENFSDFFTEYLKERGLKIRSLGAILTGEETPSKSKTE
jgi:hypothetical protein